MLQLTIPLGPEEWDSETEEFIPPPTKTLQLEHSLVSISKWESKWHKSFLHSKDRSEEEMLDYIKCMTITQNVDPEVYDHITQENVNQIVQYIDDPMTATTFPKDKTGKNNREIITSELIYYWMASFNIPFECQKWHLNRLLTFLRVCSVKNTPPKKMSRGEIMSRNAALNAARRKQLNTKG